MVKIKQCPIDRSFHHTVLHKKWTFTLLRDMMRGFKHFNEFLKTNPGLSSKVLTDRLQEMELEGLIRKDIVSKTPLDVEYVFTEKGLDLQDVLFHLSLFGAKHYASDVFEDGEYKMEESIDTFGEGFLIPKEELDRLKEPVVKSLE